MLRQEISEKFIAIVCNELKIAKEEVTEASSFKKLGADSLDLIDILVEAEEKFEIKLADANESVLKTIRELVDEIEAALCNAGCNNRQNSNTIRS